MPVTASGGKTQPRPLLLLFTQQVHIQIACGFDPVLVHFDRKCAAQAETAGGIGKDTHHQRPAFQFLVQPLEQVRRLQVLVVRQRKCVKVKVSSMLSSTQRHSFG
jgi:hypothetical protein